MPAVEHVLMTADAVGGIWTFALDLVRMLGRRGVHVTLAVTGPAPNDGQLAELLSLPAVDYYHHPSRLEWMDDPWDDIKAAGEWVKALTRQHHPDVLHLNGYCLASLAWDMPVLVTGHSCVLSWWRAVHGQDAPPQWDEYADRVNDGLRAADLVTSPTNAMLHALDRHYGPLTRTRVICNGRCLGAARVVSDPPKSQEPTKEPFILTAGRLWDPAKNVAAVCAIAPHLPWTVRVAGDTRGPGRTEDVACDGVEYLGRLSPDAMASWMRRAAIYALPARYEPFGLSALEAGLAGCALVLGDIRSLREVWGDAAVFVSPNNRRMLAGTLHALIANDDYRCAMASRAGARARIYTPERMADGYMSAYASLLSGHGRTNLAS